jgi:hypothetical protein
MQTSLQKDVLELRPRSAPQESTRSEDLALLQSARFRMMTELGRGSTPMRAVDQAFQRAAKAMIGTYSGAALVAIVEEAVRTELAPTAVQIPVGAA